MQDRGAAIRICPIFGRDGAAQQFNVEYRVADAAASPYLALGALVWAGVDGIRHNRSLPPMPERSFWDMSDERALAAGVRPLPASLDEALDGPGGERRGARMVRRDLLRGVCAVQARRAEGDRGPDRSPDLRPLRRSVLTASEIRNAR